LLVSHGNGHIGVFEVTDYESVVRFTEFKMVDMSDENFEKSTTPVKIGMKGFLN